MDAKINHASGVNVYARVQGDPRQLMSQLREQVRRTDPNLVVSDVRTQLRMNLKCLRAILGNGNCTFKGVGKASRPRRAGLRGSWCGSR
jgi:hypothetical protein